MTCVVEILTTAGSTSLEIEEKTFESLTGSGIASNSAPAAPTGRVAWVRPGITVPIRMPMPRVHATKRDANSLRRLAQYQTSRSWTPILTLLCSPSDVKAKVYHSFAPRKFGGARTCYPCKGAMPRAANTASQGACAGIGAYLQGWEEKSIRIWEPCN